MSFQLEQKNKKLKSLSFFNNDENDDGIPVVLEDDGKARVIMNKCPQHIKNYATQEVAKTFQAINGEINS